MAVTKITWENKTGIQNDASVARKNKVVDEDMNEIKQVVNNNADEVSEIQENIEDLQEGQGTSDTDITNLKNRVTTLEEDNTENKSNISLLQEQFSNFENYDDTEIKQDISEIKQEQQTQNSDIENLQTNDNKQDELISKLKSAALNAETEESKSIHVTDASTIGQLEVLGNHGQETRTGKNVFDISKYPFTERIAYTSAGEQQYWDGYCGILDYFPIQENAQYTFSNSLNKPIYCGLVFYSEDKQVMSVISTNTTTFTTPENCKYIRFAIQSDVLPSWVQIEMGATATEYEQYGASPSPEYPSPVVCLGSNKNLYDGTNKNYYINISANSCGISEGDTGSIVDVKGKSNVTISSSIAQTRFRAGCINSEVTGNTAVTLYNGLNKDNSIEMTINCEEYNYLVINATDLSKIKVEEGTEATSYSPYGQGSTEIKMKNADETQEKSYTLPIQQEMLKGDYFIKEADGWKEVHGWNKIILTGNENLIKSGASSSDKLIAVLAISNGIDGFGYSNYFKYSETFGIGNFRVYNNGTNLAFGFDSTEIATLEEAKSFLTEKYNAGNPVYFYYKTATPTKLACTEEQSAVLEELNNMDLFEGVNNIITTEDIALLNLKYALDVETYVDNKLNTINQQILEIAGGN